VGAGQAARALRSLEAPGYTRWSPHPGRRPERPPEKVLSSTAVSGEGQEYYELRLRDSPMKSDSAQGKRLGGKQSNPCFPAPTNPPLPSFGEARPCPASAVPRRGLALHGCKDRVYLIS